MIEKLARKEFARYLIENRKNHNIEYIQNEYHLSPAYIVYLSTGCYWNVGFLIHSPHDNIGELVEIIAEYCRDKGHNGYFAEEERLTELRQDALNAGHDEEDFVNDFYMYTESGYINTPSNHLVMTQDERKQINYEVMGYIGEKRYSARHEDFPSLKVAEEFALQEIKSYTRIEIFHGRELIKSIEGEI